MQLYQHEWKLGKREIVWKHYAQRVECFHIILTLVSSLDLPFYYFFNIQRFSTREDWDLGDLGAGRRKDESEKNSRPNRFYNPNGKNCPEFAPLGYAQFLRSQTELFAT